MAFKRRKVVKHFKPRFRKNRGKKFPLYKKIGRIWSQKTKYMKIEGRLFMNLPKLSVETFDGFTYALRVGGDMCSYQYVFAFSMQAFYKDCIPYMNQNPWSAADVKRITLNATPGSAGSTQPGYTSSFYENWSRNPPSAQPGLQNYKLNELLYGSENYWVMQQDFRLETDYQATKLVSVAFYDNGGNYLSRDNVSVRYYFATDPNLISFNKGTGLNNGQRDNVISNYLDSFKNVSEYSPEISNKKNKKIRMKNPAVLSESGGIKKMLGLNENYSNVNSRIQGQGFVYLIIACNVQLPEDGCKSMSLNLGQLTVTKHIAYVPSKTWKTNPGQIPDGVPWNPALGLGMEVENTIDINSQKSDSLNNIDKRFKNIKLN